MADRDDTLYLDGIRTENGETVIDAHGAEQTLAWMALSMRTFFEANADEGTNYIQTGVRHEGKTWNFVVYPSGKPTPHDLRRQADAERDEALAAVQRVRALANDLGTPIQSTALWVIADRIHRALTPPA